VYETELRFIVAVAARSSRAAHDARNFAAGALRFLRFSMLGNIAFGAGGATPSSPSRALSCA
jgi:hypothetical protein